MSGVERVNGGGLNDTVTLGAASVITLSGVENVVGSSSADVVTFGANTTGATASLGLGLDKVVLGGGTNSITITPGVETVDGTAGTADTVILGGAAGTTNVVTLIGIENVTAGAANDRITMTAAVNGSFNFGGGSDALVLGGGDDSVNVSNIEAVNGGAGNDVIRLMTTAGAALRGNNGADTLIGNDGRDQLRGGAGADQMTGGGGADVFVFASGEGGTNAARDVITDFVSGADPRLATDPGLDADLIMVSGLLRGEFTWLGRVDNFAVTGSSQARAGTGDNANIVFVDTDGNGAVNFEIRLVGVTTANLVESDFLWT